MRKDKEDSIYIRLILTHTNHLYRKSSIRSHLKIESPECEVKKRTDKVTIGVNAKKRRKKEMK